MEMEGDENQFASPRVEMNAEGVDTGSLRNG